MAVGNLEGLTTPKMPLLLSLVFDQNNQLLVAQGECLLDFPINRS